MTSLTLKHLRPRVQWPCSLIQNLVSLFSPAGYRLPFCTQRQSDRVGSASCRPMGVTLHMVHNDDNLAL